MPEKVTTAHQELSGLAFAEKRVLTQLDTWLHEHKGEQSSRRLGILSIKRDFEIIRRGHRMTLAAINRRESRRTIGV